MDEPVAPTYQGLDWISAKLPLEVEPWPAQHAPSEPGASSSEADRELTRGEAERYIAGKVWSCPGRVHYFLTDLHADADAFLASLVATGGVRRTGPADDDIELLSEGQRAQFVIGGDCFDKGPSNLRLLRALAGLLRTGARVELLAGNHDLRTALGIAFLGAEDPRYAHLFVRLGPKSLRLFEEVYSEYLAGSGGNCGKSEAATRELLFPGDDWYESFPEHVAGLIPENKLESELQRIREKTREIELGCARIGMSLSQVHAAAEKCRELFLEPGGEFRWYFDRVELAYRAGSFLFVHAGVDDETAALLRDSGVDGLNRRFRSLLEQDLFTLYHGPLGSAFRTKYRDVDFPLTEAGLCDVRDAGVHAIAHGHRNLPRGQRLMLRRGLLHFECDASVDRNTRARLGLPGAGAAATIFREDGSVLGVSSDHPRVKVFDLAVFAGARLENTPHDVPREERPAR